MPEGCQLLPHSRKAAFFRRGTRRHVRNSFVAMPLCLAPNRSSACLMISSHEGIHDCEMKIWPPALNFLITMPLDLCERSARVSGPVQLRYELQPCRFISMVLYNAERGLWQSESRRSPCHQDRCCSVPVLPIAVNVAPVPIVEYIAPAPVV